MADVKVSSLASLTGASVDVAADVINIVDTSATTSGSKKIKVEELFKSASLVPQFDSVTMNKATGKGIKVDTTTPTYGYRDITGDIIVRGNPPTDDPTWAAFRGSIWAYDFPAVGSKYCYLSFHVPHDYVPGSDIYFHAHWGNKQGTPNTGTVIWSFDYSAARGYDQEVFPAATTVAISKACHATQYMHQISETVAVTIANLEVDSLILVRVTRDTADTCTDAVSLFCCDIHYQSTNLATKAKNGPAFYT